MAALWLPWSRYVGLIVGTIIDLVIDCSRARRTTISSGRVWAAQEGGDRVANGNERTEAWQAQKQA